MPRSTRGTAGLARPAQPSASSGDLPHVRWCPWWRSSSWAAVSCDHRRWVQRHPDLAVGAASDHGPTPSSPWVALDEWRSRKRTEDEHPGHGWIWSGTSSPVWTDAGKVNRIALSIVSAAFVVGALIAYADRITEADLQQERLVVVVQTTLVIMLDLWVVAVAIRLGYTIRSCFAFGAQYCESWLESPS